MKKNEIIDPHNGIRKYYGRGKKKDVALESYDDHIDTYWTNMANKFLKKRSTK